MNCSHCGADAPDTAKFCTRCGQPLAPPSPPPQRPSPLRPLAIVLAVLIVALGVVIALILAQRGGGARSYDECMALAARYLEELDYEQAEALYLEAIQLDPSQVAAYRELAQMYIDQGREAAALDVLARGFEATGSGELQALHDEITANLEPERSVEELAISAYEAIIQEYRDATAVDSETWLDNIPQQLARFPHVDSFTLERFHLGDRDGYNEIGYLIYDIDENGVPELLLGHVTQWLTVLDIFTFDGEQAVSLQKFDNSNWREDIEYCTYSVYTNGVIVVSSGDSDAFCFDENGVDLVRVDPSEFNWETLSNYELDPGDDWTVIASQETASATEEELRTALAVYLTENGLPDGTELIAFLYDDYDYDGRYEAFAVTGLPEEFSVDNLFYFVSSDGTVTLLNADEITYGYLPSDPILDTGSAKFFLWEESAAGSSSITWVFGLQDGSAYQPQISRQYMEFHATEENRYFGLESEYNPYHEYYSVEFSYDGQAGEFILIPGSRELLTN